MQHRVCRHGADPGALEINLGSAVGLACSVEAVHIGLVRLGAGNQSRGVDG